MARPRYLLLLLLLLLVACDQATPPPSTPVPPQATDTAVRAQATTTDVPAQPTAAAQLATSPTPVAGQAELTPGTPPGVSSNTLTSGIFVVPTTVALDAARGLDAVKVTISGHNSDVAREVGTYFESFYELRTIRRGDGPNGEKLVAIRNLTDEPYLDYAVTQVQGEIDDVSAGKLVEITYSGISAKVDKSQIDAGGTGNAEVSVTRTRQIVRTGAAPASDTATLRFKMERRPWAGNFAWLAVDFYNPNTGHWVSETVPPPPQDVKDGVADFFRQFYAARTLAQGGRFDLDKSGQLVLFAYADYTMPLLQRQQAEADAGKLVSVSYADIGTTVTAWYPLATSHGGIGTVKVTRTAHVVRPSGAEPPHPETFQFRVHRHQNEPGAGRWVAVDFLSPITGRWVSESAGMSGPVPGAGQG